MKRINEAQLQILEALNTYRFLSVGQMISLGISKTKYSISKNTSVLLAGKKPLLAFADFGTFPSIGRLPRLYYLTKHGAEWLAEAFGVDAEDINHPKGVKIFTREYFHRVATINLHISARKFTDSIKGMEFDFYHTYFEHTGANHTRNPNTPKRQALTRITLQDRTFIPDVIFSLHAPDGVQWMFTAEIYRNHTTKRTYQQLEHHIQSLAESGISKAYQYPRAVRVLMVCEELGAMKALQKRIAEDPKFKPFEAFILFKTTDDISRNFPAGWQSFTGQIMNAFEVPRY